MGLVDQPAGNSTREQWPWIDLVGVASRSAATMIGEVARQYDSTSRSY